ncbi:MAG: adenosylcobinamide-GDP ribazoletransferase [Clostridia bacterium]|nr:adenosylcobinamide-GDP ribazoletransferase [Clostridia bacterium]
MASPLVIAFATYSRIPTPRVDWSEENRRYSLCFFPLIGVVIGLLMAAWLYLCDALGVGPVLRGAFGAVIPLLITGGIHMDGFMDVSDALSAWQTKERRLEILKDSHVGAFAVMHCAMVLLMMAGLLSEAAAQDAPLLGACFVFSRAMSAWTSVRFKGARQDGMLRSFTQAAGRRAVTVCSAAYAMICLIVWGMEGGYLVLALIGAAVLCTLYYRHMAYTQFGGVTGDLAGWLLQITELTLIAVIIIGGRII